MKPQHAIQQIMNNTCKLNFLLESNMADTADNGAKNGVTVNIALPSNHASEISELRSFNS